MSNNSGAPATQAQFQSVLCSPSEIFIRGEFQLGLDVESPDNVILAPSAPVWAGTPVTYTATASGGCSSNLTLVCLPPSGSPFPPGVAMVKCHAWDGYGSSNWCTFTVTILDATNCPPCPCPVAANAPPNDTPATATQLTAGATVSGCLQYAGPTPRGVAGLFPPVGPLFPSPLRQENAKDVWFSFTPTVDGNVTVDTCGPAEGGQSHQLTILIRPGNALVMARRTGTGSVPNGGTGSPISVSGQEGKRISLRQLFFS